LLSDVRFSKSRANRAFAWPPRFSPQPRSRSTALPAPLVNACFVLSVINIVYFPIAYFSHWWIYDSEGLGIPTDFINVWAAGRLALEGHPAQAWDWDIQKQVELALLRQDFPGYFA
jgi:arabinofuranan 3-O-arabinosyltransferase